MALVHKNNLAVYSGVSKQAIDLRLETYCEEMINCYPSIQYGVRRRNPTYLLSNDIIVDNQQFVYTYDRGLSGESLEQYVITIDRTNGLKVFDIASNTYKNVSYSGSALDYLESSNPEIGFAAITIKDTTFIANRDITPMMIGTATGTITMHTTTSQIGIGNSDYSFDSLAPSRVKVYTAVSNIDGRVHAISSLGAITTITVDGIVITNTTKLRSVTKIVKHKRPTKKNLVTLSYTSLVPETVYEYSQNIIDLLQSKLDQLKYRIVKVAGNKLAIQKLDGTAVTVSASISYPTTVTSNPTLDSFGDQFIWSYLTETNVSSDVFGAFLDSTSTESVVAVDDYDKIAYIWIKQVSVDPSFPFTFKVTLKETDGTVISSTSSSATTTNDVASAISTWASGLTDFSSQVEGSVCKIVRDSGAVFEIVVSDSYGNQASIGFKGSITSMNDIPKSFPFKGAVLKVDGIQKSDDIAYWIRYDGNSWIEWRDPNTLNRINNSTMPHKLVRNADFTFTLSPITWMDMLVGDDTSQAIPTFIGSKIRDLFFVNGRLGILTKNGISLSQQNEFYNFFRTTILTILDDSAISTYIDSSKSIGLEYATELQGNIILFGDKLQFALDGGKGITPANISVKPISGFEINKNVRPVSVGDSVFFIVSKNNYSSLMEMNQTTVSMNIRALDVSSHVTNYIDNDIMQIAYSQRDNTLFLRSRTDKNILYVYKYFSTDQQYQQMAWSKWEFSMDINSAFVFDKGLYLFGERYDSSVPLDEFSLVSLWNDNKYWIDDTYWVDEELLKYPSLEKIDIEPYIVTSIFKDLGTVHFNSEIELSEWALSDSNKQKETRGSLLMKTIEVSASEDSLFDLVINDLERGTDRVIPSIYTVNRKPFVSGNAKNMRIKIQSTNGDGFQINSISLEGQYNVRSKKV